ncbi:EF-hand domain-containing protein [Erythrobacter sp. SDW2]|uniref:EF-hand domain-containing protein n=1 Tax=Erythrobacter sp. SDW2 TaxID=2907154 RepID=UPI001F48B7EC|nr:EF-hand domain-containing protein [Erythrobacter sp. SDW2]UIP07710.1 EF-hand domain-containing protein [Erythrobacter sp. SDW2]
MFFRGSIAAVMALLAATGANAQQAAEPLTRQVFITQMDAEFKRLDGDGNGMVVAAEIVASQQQDAQAEALRQNQIVFGQLDKNGDNQLSPEEFSALANPSAIPVDATPLLNQFDTDRDGIITLVEYRIATQANFDRVDSDRDGVITDMEMRAAGIQP